MTESWDSDLVSSRIRFLETAANVPPTWLRPDHDAPQDQQPRNDAESQTGLRDIHALLGAADLSFATNDTKRGIRLIRRALTAIIDNHSPSPEAALLGAITTTISTVLFGKNFVCTTSLPDTRIAAGGTISLAYPALTPMGLNLMADLLCAAVATNPPSKAVQIPVGQEQPLPILGALAGLQPVAGALAAFGLVLDPRGSVVTNEPVDEARKALAHRALSGMTLQWAGDLSLHRADSHHWQQARVRGPLIDLRRVTLELALRRTPEAASFTAWREKQPPMSGLAGELEKFTTDLAHEIERS